jgi:uncharacterized protein involved in type VI secretion and phage assembly
MSDTPRSRDLFRVGVASAAALVSAASLTAVGLLAGEEARRFDQTRSRTEAEHAAAVAKATRQRARYDAMMARRRSAALPRRVVLRPRPTRTVVRTHYVQGATSPVVLGGGTVSPASPGSPVVHHQAPVYHAPPPPPPPPPPAPSSGS